MLFDKFKHVKAFVFAVDGALTDGGVWMSPIGEQWRVFNSRDGYAIRQAIQRGYPIAFVNSGDERCVKAWMNSIGCEDGYRFIGDKKSAMDDWLSYKGVDLTGVLYMGADLGDLDKMDAIGFPTCPSDATEEVKAVAGYISSSKGGSGAVRDVIEKTLKLQGKWGVQS